MLGHGGHEVIRPVAVEGAETGAALVTSIKQTAATSVATPSAVHRVAR
jgi:hypothetical protein